jgi:TRAP-type C4-dicarboxylate transport system substrate-binding protein
LLYWILLIIGGYVMRNKVLLIFLALVLIVSMAAFTACGGEEEPTPTTPTTPTTPPEPQVYEWNFAIPVPLPGAYGAFFETFGTDIERITNGRVKITNFFGGTLGKAPDQLEMLTAGTAHIIYHVPPWTPGVFPLRQ